MRGLFIRPLAAVLIVVSITAAQETGQPPTPTQSDSSYLILKTGEAVVQLFRKNADRIWPGFDLSRQPFIVYQQEWALLFNGPDSVDGFQKYPASWPRLEARVLYCPGQYKDLVGQLAFDVPVDTLKAVALGYIGVPAISFFAYVVHEAFHQYQRQAFGDIPWAREELYPIEDTENTALAVLEMRLLQEALKAKHSQRRELIREFLAVRDTRWNRDDFVKRYEQGQELNEGTAKYVEVRGVELAERQKGNALRKDIAAASGGDYLGGEFQARYTGSALAPEDVLRNRIYPVGAALGKLLDELSVSWKAKAQAAGTEFSFAEMLRSKVPVDSSALPGLVEQTKARFRYSDIKAAADSLDQAYQAGFKAALDRFEATPGYRIEITLSAKNLRRSRSSSAKHWLMDKGSKDLRDHYKVYVLSSALTKDLSFEVHDAGLLEENDWQRGIRKVAFFTARIDSCRLDDQLQLAANATQSAFNRIELAGDNFKLSYSGKGTLASSRNHITITLAP